MAPLPSYSLQLQMMPLQVQTYKAVSWNTCATPAPVLLLLSPSTLHHSPPAKKCKRHIKDVSGLQGVRSVRVSGCQGFQEMDDFLMSVCWVGRYIHVLWCGGRVLVVSHSPPSPSPSPPGQSFNLPSFLPRVPVSPYSIPSTPHTLTLPSFHPRLSK